MNTKPLSTVIQPPLKHATIMVLRLMTWSVVTSLWLSGCSQKPATESPQKPDTAAGQSASWTECLELWKGGNQSAAVEKFLNLDWDAPDIFSSSSPLHYSEADIVGLSAATREQVMKEAMAEIQTLKSLAAQVQELRKQALAQKDQAKADQCVQCLQHCGARLEQPSSMKILQLVGTAVKKMAAREP